MQEWVLQIPSIPILVSALFPSLHIYNRNFVTSCVESITTVILGFGYRVMYRHLCLLHLSLVTLERNLFQMRTLSIGFHPILVCLYVLCCLMLLFNSISEMLNRYKLFSIASLVTKLCPLSTINQSNQVSYSS